MKKINFKKGFTLIELLVVVAIIGILSSIIMVSLNRAKLRGIDLQIKAGLINVPSQASAYYEATHTFLGVCLAADYNTPPGVSTTVDKVAAFLQKYNTAGYDSVPWAYSSWGRSPDSAVCHDSDTGWAVLVSLEIPDTENAGWCIDSTGFLGESTSLGRNVVVCQ